jgi:hypothetical protein
MFTHTKQEDASVDTWKGEKLHGPDRRLTRAQLEEMDRVPRPRRTRRYRATVRIAKLMGQLYVLTKGRGPRWREAVTSLSVMLYGRA